MMTEKEYAENLTVLKKVESEAKSKCIEAKHAVENFIKEYSYQVAENYTSYIGKKVIIHYRSGGEERVTNVGYLKEFLWVSNNCFYETGLYPFLLKPKKDGSMSKAPFPEWDNTQAEVKRIIRIEEIE